MTPKRRPIPVILLASGIAAFCKPAADAPPSGAPKPGVETPPPGLVAHQVKQEREGPDGSGPVNGPIALGVAPFAIPDGGLPTDLTARGFPAGVGLFLGHVYQDGPAARAGIEKGSILLALGGEPLDGAGSLSTVLGAYRPGDTVVAKAWRGGLLREFTITLEDDLTVFRRACEGGDALGCFEIGSRLEARGRTSRDSAEAVSLLRRGCDGGAMAACINLGIAYENGDLGLEEDPQKATALYERACDQSVRQGCFNLARYFGMKEQRMVRDGVYGYRPRDKERAIELYGRVCGWGDPEACFQAGQLSSTDESSAEFYQRACELGHETGCELFEHKVNRLERRRKRQKERERANDPERMLQSCESGDLQACSRLSRLYAKGEGVPQDMGKAIALARGACESGYEFACRQALRHQGLRCVWTYKIAGQSHVRGSEAGNLDACARDAARHVASVCAAEQLDGERVSGSASFFSDRGRVWRPVPERCPGSSQEEKGEPGR